MVNMVNTAVNNNIYAGRKSGSKYNQSKAFQQKEVLETPDVAAVNKYANHVEDMNRGRMKLLRKKFKMMNQK